MLEEGEVVRLQQQEHEVEEDESSVCLLVKGSESSSTPTKSPRPSSSSPKLSSKVVTFEDDDNLFETYHVTHWKDMTPKEIGDIWIQDEEFARIRDVSSKIVDRNETMMSMTMQCSARTTTSNGGTSSSLPASSSILAVYDYDKKCNSKEKDPQGKWYLRGLECWLPDIQTHIDSTIKTSIHEILDAQSMGYDSDFLAELYSEYCKESSYVAHIIGIKDQLIANRIYKEEQEECYSNSDARGSTCSSSKSTSFRLFQVLKMAVRTNHKKKKKELKKDNTKPKQMKLIKEDQQQQAPGQGEWSNSRPRSSSTTASAKSLSFGWIRERTTKRRRVQDSKKMTIKTKNKIEAKNDNSKMNVDLSYHSNNDPSYTTVECWDECEI